MIAVGGLTDFAAGQQRDDPAYRRRQQAVRGASEGPAQAGGDVSANVEVRPGDILIIPQSLF